MEIITIIATVMGYTILGLILLGLIISLYQWLLYGEIGSFSSQTIKGNKVFINGKLVAETTGKNVSVINGNVYENGKLIYKHKRKFRWEK